MKSKIKLLNLEPKDFSPAANEILRSFAEVVEANEASTFDPQQLQGVHGLISRLNFKIDESLLAGADQLRVVATATTGLNHVDQTFLAKQGIALLSLKGETEFLKNITATAELTWALLLSLAREIPRYQSSVLSGEWNRKLFPAAELSGKTIGIIGLGRLGQMVAEYAKAFRMNVIAFDTQANEVTPFANQIGCKMVSLEVLLAESDVVSLHASYSEANHEFLNFAQFSKMTKRPIFLNTARGELVNEADLVRAIKEGFITKAAIDVLGGEVSKDKDWMKKSAACKFAENDPRLLITPHIGGATPESMHKTELFLANKIKDFFNSK